jgi:hypothetical protein
MVDFLKTKTQKIGTVKINRRLAKYLVLQLGLKDVGESVRQR